MTLSVRRGLASLGRTATIVGRLLGIQDSPVPDDWTHVTKIDPERGKDLPLCFPLYLQHTSAVEVGGSTDVTDANTEETLELVANRPRPAIQEPSGVKQITERTRSLASFMAIPEVLNGDVESLIGTLGAGVEYLDEELAPEAVDSAAGWLPDRLGALLTDAAVDWILASAAFEAYIVMNPDSAAARESGVTDDDLLDPRTAKRRAMAAERHLHSEIIYLEYSGTFGGTEATAILDAIAEGVSRPQIWYGGGLGSRADARAVLEAGADAVVVGNVFHDIADEQRSTVRRALTALDHGADRAAIASWIDDAIDVSESSAASYLSTNTDVARPTERAREYLITTIATALSLDAARADLPADPDRAAVAAAVERADPPAIDALAEVVDRDWATELLVAALADSLDIETDRPVQHLATPLLAP
ncbi:MAG: geranylgeranylglyceryl/heptaprenylglyceryl phosphate synthase [Halococcoides sp.]